MKLKKLENAPKMLLWFSLGIFIVFSMDAIIQTGISEHFDFSFASNYGELLGGIFSFISVVLIYFTIKYQIDAFNKTQFENRFFEMIRYHRENIDKFEFRLPSNEEFVNPVIATKNSVLLYIYRDILKCLSIIDINFKKITLTKLFKDEVVQKREENNSRLIERQIDLISLSKYNIAYLIVFFGVQNEGRKILEKILMPKYNNKLIKKILDEVQKIPTEWDKNSRFGKNENRIKENKHFKYFGGHQVRLGHYFRHLYQSVNYVNSSLLFTYKEKYKYIKLLRAQLTTYEQFVFFFNSLSDIGRAWELNEEDTNSQLITKYNLIKNIPAEYVTDIEVKKYYPDVKYEGGHNSMNKIKLIDLYS